MNPEYNAILDHYKDAAAKFRQLRDQMVKEGASADIIATCDAEINRYEDHARRLETDHAECVTACCPACTCGGADWPLLEGLRLYILDEGNPETRIPVLTDAPKYIRSDVGNEDHGGMPWEDFSRVCNSAEIKPINSLAELPADLRNCYPYIGGSADDYMLSCAELCERMGPDGVISLEE